VTRVAVTVEGEGLEGLCVRARVVAVEAGAFVLFEALTLHHLADVLDVREAEGGLVGDLGGGRFELRVSSPGATT